jgi:hypothetical protein
MRWVLQIRVFYIGVLHLLRRASGVVAFSGCLLHGQTLSFPLNLWLHSVISVKAFSVLQRRQLGPSHLPIRLLL